MNEIAAASASSTRPRARSSSGILDQLDAEWDRLRWDRRRRQAVASWGIPLPGWVLAEGRILDLADVLVATDRRFGADADRLLAALVERSKQDELARTLVLRRLLPVLLTHLRRYRFVTDRPTEQLLAAACIAIAQYDVAARPTQVAPRLASDAVYLAFRRDLRRRRSGPVEVATEDCELDRVADWRRWSVDLHDVEQRDVELAEVLASGREAGVDEQHLAFLAELAAAPSVDLLASRLGVTDRTIRNRRRAAVERLRAAVA